MDPKEAYGTTLREVKKRIAGKEDVIKQLFIALVSNGHALLEGVPGVAKTTMVKTLAEAIQATFGRIQGTPDLDFEDIIGHTYIENEEMKLKKGQIFNNILLVDELNRAPPKTTTALLEALEERQVTVGDETFPLEKLFIALATQNPLNIEGTNPIPKVLADRFIMRIAVDYPTMQEEQDMLRLKEGAEIPINKVLAVNDILAMQQAAKGVKVSDSIIQFITRVVDATRTDIHVVMGASPRAEIAFLRCSKAKALIEGRPEVSLEDIKFLARPILSHRIVVRATGGVGVNGVIDGVIAQNTRRPTQ